MKQTSFNVRCSKELKERLKAIAVERKCSITDVVTDFVAKSICEYDKQKNNVFFDVEDLDVDVDDY